MNIGLNYNSSISNSLFELSQKEIPLSKAMEDIATGDTIRKASHNPTVKHISEKIKYSKSDVYQAIQNIENATKLVQTAEGGIQTIESQLLQLKQSAIQASNEGAYTEVEQATIQIDNEKAIEQIRRVAKSVAYAGQPLLDGDNSVNFASRSPFLTVAGVSNHTATSIPEGHTVTILADAAKASATTEKELTDALLSIETIAVAVYQNGASTRIRSERGESAHAFVERINHRFETVNISLSAQLDAENKLRIESDEYGSNSTFRINFSDESYWDEDPNLIQTVAGTDIVGLINGTESIGDGRLLSAREGTKEFGLEVFFSGVPSVDGNDNPTYPISGYVVVNNKSLGVQAGTNSEHYETFNLHDYTPEALGRNIENSSGIKSIADIDTTDFTHAQDSLLVIDQAIREVSLKRAELGAFQKDALGGKMADRRNEHANLATSYAALRDTDYALEISKMTKLGIARSANISALQGAEKHTGNMLTLLN